MADTRIVTDIVANDRASRVFGQVGASAEKTGGRLSGLGKVAGLAIGGAAVGGVLALGAAMIRGVGAAASYESLQLKTVAVLKSTGNAAGTSVGGIQDLASQLESLSGVDEGLIINSQNVLATFTGIRNSAGKNNDIFDQATKVSLDLSTALGTDLQGASIQLGKALNDPIAGVGALSEVGVSFTKQQKDQIKTLVDSGDTMGAQKVILAELSKEFGGAAKAAGGGFAGSMARVKDAGADALRTLGGKLLPSLTSLANWMTAKGIPALTSFAGWVGPKIGAGFRLLGAAGRAVWSFLSGQLWPAIQRGVATVMPALRLAADNVRGAFGSLKSSTEGVRGIMSTVWPILKLVGAILGGILIAAIVVVSFNMRILAGIIGHVVIPIFRAVLGVVLGFVSGFLGGLRLVFVAASHIPGVGDKFKAAVKGIDAAKRSVDGVKSSLDRVKSKTVTLTVALRSPSGLRVSSGVTGRIALARGGVIREHVRGIGLTTGTQYDIGEAGPEVVSPLNRGGPRGPGGRGGGDTIIINVNGALDPVAVARQIDSHLLTAKRQGWRPNPAGALA